MSNFEDEPVYRVKRYVYLPDWLVRWWIGKEKCRLLELGHTVAVPFVINLLVVQIEGSLTVAPEDVGGRAK